VIQPHEGNYDICQQARKAIRHILDRVLSTSFELGPSLSAAQDASGADWLLGGNAGGNAGFGVVQDDGADFMKWIDNLDWGQEPWVGFS
jgi:chromatin structure-remodeling complex subunit RSC3/30